MSNSFIDGLVATSEPVSVHRGWIDYGIVALIGGLEFLGIAIFFDFGYLASLLDAEPLRMAVKIGTFGGLALASAALAIASFSPEARYVREGAILIGVAAIVAAVSLLDPAFGGSVNETFMPMYGVECAMGVTAMALPVTLGLALLMNRGASTQPRRTAFLVGLSGGSFGAFMFALQCPFVSIWYVGLWYGVTVGLVGFVASLLLPRFARW